MGGHQNFKDAYGGIVQKRFRSTAVDRTKE